MISTAPFGTYSKNNKLLFLSYVVGTFQIILEVDLSKPVKKQQATVDGYVGVPADKLADATGAKTLSLESCHNITKEDFDNNVTYIDLMRRNLENLREALS